MKQSNDIKELKAFLREFNPFFNKEVFKNMTYLELIEEVKDTVKEMK